MQSAPDSDYHLSKAAEVVLNAPKSPPPTTTLKRKLLKIVLGVLTLVALSILGLVSYLNMRTEQVRLVEIESQVRAKIESKARVLVDNHALALRGLVADNVFSDIKTLVERAVTTDDDIVYGLFVSAEGQPWAYTSPSTLSLSDPQAQLEKWTELGLTRAAANVSDERERTATLFKQNVFEVARPVMSDGELLGTVRYGFSTDQLRIALNRARADSQRALYTLLQTIALCVVCSTLIGFVWVTRAATHIVKPLNDLKIATDRIAAGEKGVRVHVDSDDEIQALATAFNGMQEANEETMRKLSEAMEAALEASRLKSEFLANMSHEIRTPMNGVIGMIRLILQMPLDSKIRRYAETVDVSAGALMTIINDILDFSKMEAGKYDIQTAPFEPGTILQEVAELLAGRAHAKGLELVYRKTPEVPAIVTGDPDRYRQIVSNLVGNAVKFTDVGEVYVEQTLDEQTEGGYLIRTTVQDTGVGISKEDQEKLFSAFSQVDGSMVRKHGGTGLGLAISKRLAEMMGGEIGVSSEPELGSRFWFTILVKASDAPKRSALASLPDERRVLVVEGNKRWCQIIEEHLLAWGLSCDVFQSGKEALRELERESARPYDIAVIGALLRDSTIESFVQQLRKNPSAKTIPLIALTQLGESATLSEVENELAAQLTKPLRLSELYDCIVGAFSGRRDTRSQPRLAVRRSGSSDKTVLVVDDNEINRFVAREQVETVGYRVETASNGQIAVEMIKKHDFVLVLMDCQMPVMDGYTAVAEVRKWEKDVGKHTPIIALTAHAMAGERDKVLAAGMDDYLSKPLRAHALEKMLDRYVATKHTTKTQHQSEPTNSSALDGEIERSARLIELFLDQVPKTLTELENSIREDQGNTRALAHKLKGSCLALGARLMADEAEMLQHEAERKDFNLASTRAAALRDQFERVRQLLLSELEKKKPRRLSSAPS